jgi:hypothetical protein
MYSKKINYSNAKTCFSSHSSPHKKIDNNTYCSLTRILQPTAESVLNQLKDSITSAFNFTVNKEKPKLDQMICVPVITMTRILRLAAKNSTITGEHHHTQKSIAGQGACGLAVTETASA